MREPANEGSSTGAVGGGIVAVVVAFGALLARTGDDIGRFVGTGAHLVDEVAIVGTVGDDLGRAAVRAEDLGLDVVSHGADAASIAVDGAALVTDEGAAAPASPLDPDASTGPPVLSQSEPADRPGPQLILVPAVQSPDLALARCAAEGRWCVVEQLGGEERDAIVRRFAELAGWWERDHPTDAAWVEAFGARLPPDVTATWLAPSTDGIAWTVRHP